MVERSFLVNIAGGHATGIDELSKQIEKKLVQTFPDAKIQILNLDQSSRLVNGPKYYSYKDYDFDMLYNQILGLKNAVENGTPLCSKDDKIRVITILCGCYALYDKRINRLSDLKVFLDSDADKLLINLIKKRNCTDPKELSSLLNEYMDNLRVEMDRYIQPTRAFADIIIPSKNETLGKEIVVNGIFQLVNSKDATGHSLLTTPHTDQPLWDFQGERMDVEKSRYYDLS
ncbi:putative uridine kinase Das2p [Monosporozyma servazzii]